MKEKTDRNKLIERLKKAAGEVFADSPILFAYLYGSRAKSKEHPLSDFDIAVYVKDSDYSVNKELSLNVNLEKASHLKRIDLRTLNNRPLTFQGKVIQEGILIYSKDEKTRINFERNTMHMYLDYLPHLKKLRQRFLKKVATEGLL